MQPHLFAARHFETQTENTVCTIPCQPGSCRWREASTLSLVAWPALALSIGPEDDIVHVAVVATDVVTDAAVANGTVLYDPEPDALQILGLGSAAG